MQLLPDGGRRARRRLRRRRPNAYVAVTPACARAGVAATPSPRQGAATDPTGRSQAQTRAEQATSVAPPAEVRPRPGILPRRDAWPGQQRGATHSQRSFAWLPGAHEPSLQPHQHSTPPRAWQPQQLRWQYTQSGVQIRLSVRPYPGTAISHGLPFPVQSAAAAQALGASAASSYLWASWKGREGGLLPASSIFSALAWAWSW